MRDESIWQSRIHWNDFSFGHKLSIRLTGEAAMRRGHIVNMIMTRDESDNRESAGLSDSDFAISPIDLSGIAQPQET